MPASRAGVRARRSIRASDMPEARPAATSSAFAASTDASAAASASAMACRAASLRLRPAVASEREASWAARA